MAAEPHAVCVAAAQPNKANCTAVLHFRSDEPAAATVTYTSTTGDAGVVRTRPASVHRVVLANLDPSDAAPASYSASVELTDPSGNTSSPVVVPFVTQAFLGDPALVVVGSLALTALPATPTSSTTRRTTFA